MSATLVPRALVDALDRLPHADSEDDSDTAAAAVPRGLINVDNRCFLASALQAIFACTPFAAYIRHCGRVADHAALVALREVAPVLAELIEFDREALAPKDDSAAKSLVHDTQMLDLTTAAAAAATATVVDGDGENEGDAESIRSDERDDASGVIGGVSKSARRRRRKRAAVSELTMLEAKPALPAVTPPRPRSSSPILGHSGGSAAFVPSFPALLQLFHPHHIGRQEDCAELLLFLLNRMEHEVELVRQYRVRHYGDGPLSWSSTANDNNDWVEVGAGNRALTVRSNIRVANSPVSALFACRLRSRLKVASKHGGSLTFQPCFILTLDIGDGVSTLSQAISAFVEPARVEGFRGSGGSRAKEAQQSQSLDAATLPRVLAIQLKRFDADARKLEKRVEFTEELSLNSAWLSNSDPSTDYRYQLAAVIVHHGAEIRNGHYTAYVRHGSDWLHVDDSRVSRVTVRAVLTATAYLLLYTRGTG